MCMYTYNHGSSDSELVLEFKFQYSHNLIK